MRKLKSIFALCLSLIMIVLTVGGMTTVSAAASIEAEAYFSATNNGLVVEGTISGSDVDNVTIFIYKPGYTIEQVEAGTKTIDKALFNATNERVSGGKFSYTCSAADNDVSGNYTVYINYGGEELEVIENVYYAVPAEADSALARINDISETYDTDEDKVAAFNEELAFLGKLPEMYDDMLSDEQKESVILKVTEKTDYATIDEVVEAMAAESVAIVILDPADADMLKFAVENYNESIGVDLNNPFYKKYVKGHADREDAVYSYVVGKAPFDSVDVIKDEFQKGVIIQTLNNISSKGEIYNTTKDTISVLKDEYNVSLLKDAQGKAVEVTKFVNLTDTKQEKLLTSFYKDKKHKVSTCEEFVANWNAAVKAASNTTITDNVNPPVIDNNPDQITQEGDTVTGIIGNGDPSKDVVTDAPAFTDLGGVEWATESITALYKAGIVNGKDAATFAPNDNITREEFLKMLYLCANLSIDEEAQTTFIDVNKGDWYYGIVASAQQQGLVNGVSNVHFGVGQNITRQDMAVMIVRMISSMGIELDLSADESKFIDNAKIAPYANVSVYTMKRAGIINGYEDGSFNPNAFATRAEAAKIIYALCSLVID